MKEEKRGCSFESGVYYSGPHKVSLFLALMSGSVMGLGKGRKDGEKMPGKKEGVRTSA